MRTETFQTPGPVRLDLELPAGTIEIETAATEETHVELVALSDREQVQEMVEAARIEMVRRGDRYDVIVEVRTRHGVWISFSKGPDIRLGTPEMRLRITCPKGAEIDARTKSADLDARGEYGEVDVKTASGDVNVASVAGDANLQLVSGDAYIRDARGSISANTVSGDQRYEAVVQGRIEVRAVSGDIGIGIRRGSRVFIDANTVSGSTSSEFELADVPAAPAAADAPLVEVYAKTVSGDVRLERAPAPAHA